MYGEFYYHPSKGFDSICSNPLYLGVFDNIDEYENIIQDDTRSKPLWSDLTTASINLLRHEIAEMLSSITTAIIYYGFAFSLYPNIKVQATIFQQNNLTDFYLLKDTTNVDFPLTLKMSEDSTNGIVSVTLEDITELEKLYNEFNDYKNEKLNEDSDLKTAISNYTLQELLSFNDSRLIPTQY